MDAAHDEEAAELFPFQQLIHRAHVIMLCETNILEKSEAAKILAGLAEVDKEIQNNPELGNYMTAEARLIAIVGDVGGKLHTARSRNDLISTTLRMYVRDRLLKITKHTLCMCDVMLDVAEKNVETVMPGYTHWQHAQPITLGHYILAHADACERVLDEIENAYASTNLSPLGACALAGTSWAISRKKTAELLGFNGILENTLDSVASRDFMAEAASAMTILLSNLSRMAIDLEIWSSFEFGLINLDERYCSTSSIMPQKKNPTVLEHIRAHAASAIGYLVQIMAALKGTAYTHIRDLNECPNAFRLLAADTLTSIDAMRGVILTMTPNPDLMANRAMTGFSTMTELADLLVRERNLSFRNAHEIVANLTNDLIAQKKLPTETTTEMLDKSSLKVVGKKMALDGNIICSAFDPLASIKTKEAGGPSPKEVRRMIDDRRRRIQHRTLELDIKTDSLATAYKKLEGAEQNIRSDATSD